MPTKKEEEKFCSCCVTEEEWKRGVRKEKLVVIEHGNLDHQLEILCCPECDGGLLELASRK